MDKARPLYIFMLLLLLPTAIVAQSYPQAKALNQPLPQKTARIQAHLHHQGVSLQRYDHTYPLLFGESLHTLETMLGQANSYTRQAHPFYQIISAHYPNLGLTLHYHQDLLVQVSLYQTPRSGFVKLHIHEQRLSFYQHVQDIKEILSTFNELWLTENRMRFGENYLTLHATPQQERLQVLHYQSNFFRPYLELRGAEVVHVTLLDDAITFNHHDTIPFGLSLAKVIAHVEPHLAPSELLTIEEIYPSDTITVEEIEHFEDRPSFTILTIPSLASRFIFVDDQLQQWLILLSDETRYRRLPPLLIHDEQQKITYNYADYLQANIHAFPLLGYGYPLRDYLPSKAMHLKREQIAMIA